MNKVPSIYKTCHFEQRTPFEEEATSHHGLLIAERNPFKNKLLASKSVFLWMLPCEPTVQDEVLLNLRLPFYA